MPLSVDLVENWCIHKKYNLTMSKAPTLTCRYHNNGCKEEKNIAYGTTGLIKHEQICAYRKQCPLVSITNCDWIQDFPTDIVTHFLNCHMDHVIKFDSNILFVEIPFVKPEVVKLLVTKNVILLLKMQLFLQKNKLIYSICHVKRGLINYNYSIKHKANPNDTGVCVKSDAKVLDASFIYKNLDEDDAATYTTVSLRPIQVAILMSDRLQNLIEFNKLDANVMRPSMLIDFECPVCRMLMKPPIFLCQLGHSLCGECKLKLTRCPICKERFITTRNYSFEKLTNYLSYPCIYEDSGCIISLGKSDIADHESMCPFKPYNCPIPECKSTGNFDFIVVHLQEDHQQLVIKNPTNCYHNRFQLINYDCAQDTKCFLVAFNQLYRIRRRLYNQDIIFIVESVAGNTETNDVIIYKVCIIHGFHPEKRLIRTDRIQHQFDEKDLETSETCIKFTTADLLSYSKEKRLMYCITIKKMV